jgi:hypothetical protein
MMAYDLKNSTFRATNVKNAISCEWARLHNSWQVRISPGNEEIEPRNCFDDFHHSAMVDLLNVEELVKVLGNILFVPSSYTQLKFHRLFMNLFNFHPTRGFLIVRFKSHVAFTSVLYLDTSFRPHCRFRQVRFDDVHSILMNLHSLKRLAVSRKR